MLLKVKCLAPGHVAHGTTRICSLTPEPASFWKKEKFIYFTSGCTGSLLLPELFL